MNLLFFCLFEFYEKYRKLKMQIPNRKIKISTKFDPNIFENSNFIDSFKEHIPGWSFVDSTTEINFNSNNYF